jgi:SAM-dependent methyltransferase
MRQIAPHTEYNNPSCQAMSEFDSYAHDYDAALARGIAVSGEDKTYFAKGRIRWLSRCLKQLGFAPRSVLDFGCGTGTATPFFLDILGAESVVGVDISAESLEVARQTHHGLPAEYRLISDYTPRESIDLAFCNGVFHHVPPEMRVETARYVAACLRPGGLFALWENNPWNPGTRYVMSRIPFDRDAIPLIAREARSVTRAAGLDPLRTDYYFIFPHFARLFRGLEPCLTKLPLGAQYQVLAQKSVCSSDT